MKRTVFYLSDGTGITVEALGHSLISQFEGIEFDIRTIPYINTPEKAEQAIQTINNSYKKTEQLPIVFATLVNAELRQQIQKTANALLLDIYNSFLDPLETELNVKSSYTVGKTHGIFNYDLYKTRIKAIDYALANDDGIGTHNYSKAEVILVGVSRCGKTPTCLYLALQFGILAANYPFSDEELQLGKIPEVLKKSKSKLFGLTIDPDRLQQIRKGRRPNSRYAKMEQCRLEINELENLFQKERIPYLNTTTSSIEEISTKILEMLGIERKGF